jgi:hypothetical protein
VKLKFTTAAGMTDTGIELRPSTEAKDLVLAPSGTVVLNLAAYSQGAPTKIPFPAVGKPCAAVAEFALLGFDGKRDSGSAVCDCP